MNECWPSRSTSFFRSALCNELWSWNRVGQCGGAAGGKSACFDVKTVVEIDGLKAGPTRSHVALRSLPMERSKSSSRRTSSSSDSSSNVGPRLDYEIALVFEKPGRYTLPIYDITQIRCKYLHQGRASIQARDSLFLLTATHQIELERLLEVIRDVKAVKMLADSRMCSACKEKGELKKKKIKQRKGQRQQQPPMVQECTFQKRELPNLVDTDEYVYHIKDLLKNRGPASQKLSKTEMPLFEGSDIRPNEVDDEVYLNASSSCEILSPEQTTAFPIKQEVVIDQIRRSNAVDGVRRKEAPRVLSEQRSVRSSDEEKENLDLGVDEDVRRMKVEKMKRFAPRTGMSEVPRKVQEEQRRVEEDKRHRDERRKFELDETEAEEKEKMAKRQESLRKLLEQERKRKDEWEAQRVEERRWKEEEGKKLKAEEERLEKFLERQLQEDDRLRKEKEDEKRKQDERLRIFLNLRSQEEKRMKDDKTVQERKQREDCKLQEQKLKEEVRKMQDLKEKEAQYKLHEQKWRDECKGARDVGGKSPERKQSEEDDKQFNEVLLKLQEQIQEKRKRDEDLLQETFDFLRQGQDRQKPRKFQESVKIPDRLAQRFRRNRVSAEGKMSPDEIRQILEEQLDKLDPRKLEEDMRRCRTEENDRSKENWGMPHHERSASAEQRRRVEEVLSSRLHRNASQRRKDDSQDTNLGAERTKDSKVHTFSSAADVRDDCEFQKTCSQDKRFLDQLFSARRMQNPRSEEEKLGKGEERLKPTETCVKPDRSKIEELKKTVMERKKIEKAADEQKKRLAQERLKAAKLEAKRLEKLVREAQKRAKAEERQSQQQKEQARQKISAMASPGLLRVHDLSYRQYEDSWNMMKTSGTKSILGYFDIPWPPHSNPLFVEEGDSLAAQRCKLRIALLRWHPDKFQSLCGNRLSPLDRGSIEARAKTVAQEVILWKSKLENSS